MFKSFSIESNPSFLALIESSTKVSITLLTSYFLGKYARRIRAVMFLNLSSPNPMIIAEKVPPNTIKIDVKRNSAWKEPPSKKKAPKIENKPSSNPKKAPILFIISNQKEILEMIVIKVYMKPVVSIPDSVNRPKVLADQRPVFLSTSLPDWFSGCSTCCLHHPFC